VTPTEQLAQQKYAALLQQTQSLVHAQQVKAQAAAHQAHLTADFAWIVFAILLGIIAVFTLWHALPVIAKATVDIWEWIVRLLTWNWYRYDPVRVTRMEAEVLGMPISQWQDEALEEMKTDSERFVEMHMQLAQLQREISRNTTGNRNVALGYRATRPGGMGPEVHAPSLYTWEDGHPIALYNESKER
jgi:hypothetical protein